MITANFPQMCLMIDQLLWGHSSRVCDISCSFLFKMLIEPDQAPHFAVSDLGLQCCLYPIKKDSRLIWVNKKGTFS